jgi:hypothetical protein
MEKVELQSVDYAATYVRKKYLKYLLEAYKI